MKGSSRFHSLFWNRALGPQWKRDTFEKNFQVSGLFCKRSNIKSLVKKSPKVSSFFCKRSHIRPFLKQSPKVLGLFFAKGHTLSFYCKRALGHFCKNDLICEKANSLLPTYMNIYIHTYRYIYIYIFIDWCCFYYSQKKCVIALLEAVFARIYMYTYICICGMATIRLLAGEFFGNKWQLIWTLNTAQFLDGSRAKKAWYVRKPTCCVHTYIHTYIHTYRHIYIYAYIHLHTYVVSVMSVMSICTKELIRVYVYVCVYVCICVHIYIYLTHINTDICI